MGTLVSGQFMSSVQFHNGVEKDGFPRLCNLFLLKSKSVVCVYVCAHVWVHAHVHKNKNKRVPYLKSS